MTDGITSQGQPLESKLVVKIPDSPERRETRTFVHDITDYEPSLRMEISHYLDNDVSLPCFEPYSGSIEAREHIRNLKIPVILPEFPSLLLHKLGEPSHDAQLSDRVARLFKPLER